MELSAASLAMSTAFNIVTESTVWSTGINGVEEDNVWICLTSRETGQLCLLHKSPEELDDLSSIGTTAPSAAFSHKKGVWPLMVIPEHVALPDSDREDTDIEDLYTADQVVYVPKLGSGQAVPRD